MSAEGNPAPRSRCGPLRVRGDGSLGGPLGRTVRSCARCVDDAPLGMLLLLLAWRRRRRDMMSRVRLAGRSRDLRATNVTPPLYVVVGEGGEWGVCRIMDYLF